MVNISRDKRRLLLHKITTLFHYLYVFLYDFGGQKFRNLLANTRPISRVQR